jgi:hypothetical protein
VLVEVSNRRLGHLVLKAVTGQAPDRAAEQGPYAPPSLHGPSTATAPAAGTRAVSLCEVLLRKLLAAEGCGDLGDVLRPDAAVWTPSFFGTSADEVRAAFDAPTVDPLSEVELAITARAAVPPRVFMEWRLSGRFTEPCFVADDLLLAPTGEAVETAGVLVATFRGARVQEAHLYYDHLALLEQLVAGTAAP